MEKTAFAPSGQPQAAGRVISDTRSVCPVCLEVIDAQYVAHGERICMEKCCEKHGTFTVPVWEGAEEFERLVRAGEGQPCPSGPQHCIGCRQHAQKTCCVLLEVSDRCNLSCPICFAGSSEAVVTPDPSLATIAGWYDMLMQNGGPFNIQLSGGEPTMRDDLPEVIRLGLERGFSFFQLNTNGLRLAQEPDYVQRLAQAGLNTVFLQFDGISDATYEAIRGRPLFDEKAAAIAQCGQAGLGVVLVPTVARGINDHELGDIVAFAKTQMPHVRGVHFQPMSFFGRYQEDLADSGRLTIPALLRALEQQSGGEIKKGDFSPANTEHPLCSFHADYLLEEGRFALQPSCAGACCCSVPSDQARRVVARKWSAPEQYAPMPPEEGSLYRADALDAFLQQRAEVERRQFALSGMAFQDAFNLDLNRLGRCYIAEVSPNGHLVPFCAYNLTGTDHAGFYRGVK